MPDEPTKNQSDQSAQPAGPVYQYDYARGPQNRGGGPPLLLIGLLGFVLVLVVGVGVMLALGVGPFARVTPSPTLVAQASPTPPITTPKPTATVAASSTPVASPTGNAGPTATPIPSGDVADALLSHIPLPIEPFCIVEPNSGPLVASASCSVDGGNIQVRYLQYADHDSMFAKYDSYRLASQIEPGTGDCNDHDSWPAENGFNVGGQPAGRWLCTEALGATTIYWIDSRLNILSQATQTVPDYARLVDFWVHESGPDL